MVKVGIISIGDELLNGFTVDTNSYYIAKEISLYNNLYVQSNISIGDDISYIKYYLEYFITNNFKILFITGGLGSTHDDITKVALSEFFNSSLILHEPHYLKLKKYSKNKNIPHIKNQSMILDISKPIDNKNGLALGMYIKSKETNIFVMPGVPREMKKMLADVVLPSFISPYYDKNIKYITILTTGIYESKLYDMLKNVIDDNNKFKVSFLPNYTGVKIRLYNLIDDKDLFLKFKNSIIKKINKYVYGYDSDKIENIILRILQKNKYTLSVAESCTGGLISKKITDVNGSSQVFKGSIIAYDNDIKINNLGIDKDIIKKKGAVSKEVALAMAKNIQIKFKTDIGIATTGISGPSGGSKNKPVGLIYIAISFQGNKICKKFNLINNRILHRKVAAHTALNMLRLLLK